MTQKSTDTGKMLAAHIAECEVIRQNLHARIAEIDSMIATLKQHTSPKSGVYWFRLFATALPLLIILGGAAAWGLDQRYVTQADLSKGFVNVRILQLEDKIFELEQKPEHERTQTERAQLSRYLRLYRKLLADSGRAK